MLSRLSSSLTLALTMSASACADKVDDAIRTLMTRQHIPGLSLAVIQNEKVVKCRGYGLASLELRVPATADTVYELASLTKAFVSNAVFLLKQDGKLSLEDKIGKYISDLPTTWSEIKIRHLLSHTSGIPDYANDLRHGFTHDATPEDIVQFVKGSPLKCVPGAKWTYSNTDYVILAMIIRKVSGLTYDQFLARRMFVPLKMAATRRDSADEVVPNRSSGYLWYGSGGLHNASFLQYMETNHGDRGILSTVKDLAKWDAALSSDVLFSPESKKEMWSPIKLNDGSTYSHGMGWFIDTVNGHRHSSHAGGSPGTATMFARYPDDGLTVIVLANGGADNVFALDNAVAQCYVPALRPQGVIELNRRIMESYTGYSNVWGGELLTIVRDKDSLVVDDGDRFTGAFKPVSKTRFIAEDCDRSMAFTLDGKGELSALAIKLGDWQTQAQPIGPLAGSVVPQRDPDPNRTLRIDRILHAFEAGGKNVEDAEGVAPHARSDFARGPAPEFAGFQSISYLTERDVAGKGIERHGAAVNRVLYYKLSVAERRRYVLIYLTGDGLVTDQDVVDR